MSKADEEFGGDLKKKFHKKIITNCMSWFFRTLFSAHFFFFSKKKAKKKKFLKLLRERGWVFFYMVSINTTRYLRAQPHLYVDIKQ